MGVVTVITSIFATTLYNKYSHEPHERGSITEPKSSITAVEIVYNCRGGRSLRVEFPC